MVWERGLGVVCRHPSKVKKVSIARGKPAVGVRAHEGGSVHIWGGSVCVSESEHDDQGILV